MREDTTMYENKGWRVFLSPIHVSCGNSEDRFAVPPGTENKGEDVLASLISFLPHWTQVSGAPCLYSSVLYAHNEAQCIGLNKGF